MLDFCDEEVVEALKYHLRDLAVTFRFGETVAAVESHPEGAITVLPSAEGGPERGVPGHGAHRGRAPAAA